MNLAHLSDDNLDAKVVSLGSTEREVLSQILHHLREVDRRRLFSKYQFSSLHAYAVSKLRYSDDQAGRRISAMRLLKELPQIEKKIASGELNLTHLSKAKALFNQERKASVERTTNEKLELLAVIEGTSKLETEKLIASESFIAQKLQPKFDLPASTEIEMRFAASTELQRKLDRLATLMSREGAVTLSEVIEKMTDIALAKLDPIKKAERAVERSSRKLAATQPALGKMVSPTLGKITQPTPAKTIQPPLGKITQPAPGKVPQPPPATSQVPRSRYIHATIRHAVYLRDGGQCTNCKSARNLEVDHIDPFAFGGASSLENLRLLCRSCNQRHALGMYGHTKMQTYLREPRLMFH